MAQVQWPQHPTSVTHVAPRKPGCSTRAHPFRLGVPAVPLRAAVVSSFWLPGPVQAQCLRPAVGWAPGQPGLMQRTHSDNSQGTSSTLALFLSMIKKCNKTIGHYNENATTTPGRAGKACRNLIVLQVPVALSATLLFRAFQEFYYE